jgi:hypothetical protein
MSWRIECHTEQYFSCDRSIARCTGSGGMSPVTANSIVTAVMRCGSSCARSATSDTPRPRSG